MKTTLFASLLSVSALVSCGKNAAEYDASGVFEATEVIVSAKAQGEITSLMADEGDPVAQGDLLGEIDTQKLSLQKQQLEMNRTATDQQKLSVETQISALTRQIQNAEKEHTRFKKLFAEKAATEKQVTDIEYQISTLKAQLTALSEQVGNKNRSIASQSLGLTRQIEQMDVLINDARITAPLAGTVLQRYCENGEYATPGKPLFKIGDTQHIKLRAYITASQLTSLKLGQEVTVMADWGETDRKSYKGTVTWISEKAEFTPKTIQTRDERANLVYAIKVSVDNDGYIKCGMYGDVKF